ncbi:MAG TPA: nucleoside triphosphatase YtkD [Bacillus sp. (in: firmicutes)]|uniref:RNA deprotection pyrophosphohydrolase n=1 Tax=Bacillus litorisediminis TaxID=2922713 RepID=UPI001FAF89C4|nr:nucleoside triphosphatase YtkD [Bacillus litorisediminis]HWO75692.1 nucleoside triphosphatase YtkD [Bacillus sp. (in: firmicutes)]
MIVFTDLNGNKIELSFGTQANTDHIQHVLCITEYNGCWLCTNHKERGIEFPGGKLEEGENPEDAAKREIFEETGGLVQELNFIGQYKVISEKEEFVKGVFYAKVKELVSKNDYLETRGPVLIDPTISFKGLDESFSFIMKDGVVETFIQYLKNKKEANSFNS